jgi:hypothetical protein
MYKSASHLLPSYSHQFPYQSDYIEDLLLPKLVTAVKPELTQMRFIHNCVITSIHPSDVLVHSGPFYSRVKYGHQKASMSFQPRE